MNGLGVLLKLMLRRERLALPLWLLAFPLVMVANLISTRKLYAAPEALSALAAQINGSPAEVALYGRVWTPTLAGLAEWKLSGSLGVLAGLLSLLLVTRHTRGEEEDGRMELLLSGAVSRSAPLTAALGLALGVNVLLALLLLAAQLSQGLAAGGALALGLGVASNGLVFAGVSALLSQVFPNARTVNLLGGGLLGLAFALRVLGNARANAGAAVLGWLSPLTWSHALRPFAGERWSVLLLFAALSAALIATAAWLNRRRDLGAGLWPARLGPAQASAGLVGVWALTWRTQRGLIGFWMLALGALGAVLGGVAASAAGQIPLNQVFAAGSGPAAPSPSDLLLTLSLVIFGGLVPAALALQLALRPRREEVSGQAETLLSLPVSRQRWLAPHLSLLLLGPALALSAFALAAGLMAGLSSGLADSGGWAHTQRLWLAALAYLPAVWLLGAAALALFGWWPRLAGLSWALLGLTALAEVLGDLHVFGAALSFSPFSRVPRLLLGESPGAALWIELVLGALLTGFGALGLRRRDVKE